MHYVYPYPHVDEVIPLMADGGECGMILPYLDIPFQHAAPNVLKAMKRPAHQEKTLERIRKWREICPDLAIRSTFIVGFPGETEEDFEELARLADRSEAGARRRVQIRAGARRAPPMILALPPFRRRSSSSRYDRFMRHQQPISAKLLAAPRRQAHQGHHRRAPARPSQRAARKWDAPEIDGSVYVASRRPLRAGDIVTVKIERADAYDLHGIAV